MKSILKIFLILVILLLVYTMIAPGNISPGANQISKYLPLLQNKKVAIFANHTSVIGNKHLVDVLLDKGINIVKIFAPEHGFEGQAADGAKIQDSKYRGVSVISLYGQKTKPTKNDLLDIDIIVFDIQDVGVRFYTYISSLQYLMEAALDNNLEFLILDRPNPNGFYIDGPIPKTKSFTGLQPVPIVYGMTIGEYALMLVGENWLNSQNDPKKLKLTVIPIENYSHKSLYIPHIPPSPNLPTIESIYWYPSIGLMEGTIMSVGRGTNFPFQVFGHPKINREFSFTPKAKPWAKHPLYENQACYGWDLRGTSKTILEKIDGKLQIKYLIDSFNIFPGHKFLMNIKNTKKPVTLLEQIKAGMSEEDIRRSWESDLENFKAIRKNYLLYSD